MNSYMKLNMVYVIENVMRLLVGSLCMVVVIVVSIIEQIISVGSNGSCCIVSVVMVLFIICMVSIVVIKVCVVLVFRLIVCFSGFRQVQNEFSVVSCRNIIISGCNVLIDY